MNTNKEDIINKSFYQFLTKGYHASSLKDMEQATGLTKGAFYHYFKNKEDILSEGFKIYFSLLKDISDTEFNRITSLKEYIHIILNDREEKIKILRRLFSSVILEEYFFQLILETEDIFPEYRKKVDEMMKNRLFRWEKIIIAAKETGEIKEVLNTTTLARNLMSVSSSMVNIELSSYDFNFMFGDMKLQFEQYYSLIKKQ